MGSFLIRQNRNLPILLRKYVVLRIDTGSASLSTRPTKAAAAAKARAIYLFLAANGWVQTLAKYKPPPSTPARSIR